MSARRLLPTLTAIVVASLTAASGAAVAPVAAPSLSASPQTIDFESGQPIPSSGNFEGISIDGNCGIDNFAVGSGAHSGKWALEANTMPTSTCAPDFRVDFLNSDPSIGGRQGFVRFWVKLPTGTSVPFDLTVYTQLHPITPPPEQLRLSDQWTPITIQKPPNDRIEFLTLHPTTCCYGEVLYIDDFSYGLDQQPDTAITAGPADPSDPSQASFSFVSSEPGSTFRCATDSGTAQTCSSPTTVPNLPDGPHTFTVYAVDSEGATDATPASYGWHVEAVPETTITSAPVTPSADSTGTFTFVSSTPNSTFTCALDNGTESACTSPKSYPGLANGQHTFTVRATAPLGTPDPSPASHQWNVQVAPPPPNAVRVVGVMPTEGAQGVDRATSVSATFSDPMDASRIDGTRVTLTSPTGPVAAAVSYDSVGRRAVLKPNQPLDPSTNYIARVRGGPDGVRSAQGGTLSSDRTWNFTTISVDPDRDTVTAADNCTTVSNPDQKDTDRDGVGDACEIGRPGTIPPEAGSSVVVKVLSGDVFIKLAGAGASSTQAHAAQAAGAPPGFVPLKGIANVGVGSTLDTRSGTVALAAATTGGARPKAGNGAFSTALFKVKQRRASKLKRLRDRPVPTDLVVQSTQASVAQAGCRPGRNPGSGVVRRVTGTTSTGFFRTIGVSSITTVRNAAWVMADRCDGTLTSVSRGHANVFDVGLKRTKRVGGGARYLAKGSFLAREGPKGRPR